MKHNNTKSLHIILRLFLLLNIFIFANFKEYDKLPISALFLLEEDILVALKCYQPGYGVWSFEGRNDGDIKNISNTYYVRKGLNGDYSISLESSVKRGYYWRVKNYKLILDQYDGTDLFKQESSFIPVPGVEDYHLLSLRSVKYPKHYVRHKDGEMVISKSSKDVFYPDATWYVYLV